MSHDTVSRTALVSLLFIAGCQSVPTPLPPAGAELRGHLSAVELRNLRHIQRIHQPGLGLVRRFRESGLLADSAEWWVAGERTVLPFAGSWRGLAGIAEFERQLGATMRSDFELDPGPSGPEIPIARLRAEPYSFRTYSGLGTEARLVVRDQAAWESLWSQIHAGSAPQPPAPAFDFSREMIVVAAMGHRSSGGYGILLEGANEDETEGVAVRVLSSSPGSNCIVTLAVTAPVDIASMPLHPGPVRFFERSVKTDCR